MHALGDRRRRAPVTRSASAMTTPPARRSAGGVLPVGRRQCTLAALIMLVTLAACVSERDALIEQGFAPAYAEGYDDGCASGSTAAGGLFDEPRKDAERYATDTQYTHGLGRRLRQMPARHSRHGPGRPAAPLERRGLRAIGRSRLKWADIPCHAPAMCNISSLSRNQGATTIRTRLRR